MQTALSLPRAASATSLTGDLAQRLEFCRWFNRSRRFIVASFLLTKRNSVTKVSVIHTILTCGPIRILTPVEGTLKLRYSVTVWCAVLDDQLIGLFIFEGRPTGGMYVRFLQDRQLPGLLEDVPLNE